MILCHDEGGSTLDFLVLTKTTGILAPFAEILGFIINYIYKGLEFIGIPNTALSIVLFTLIVNLILMPMTIKQQKSSKMMSVMNPELQKIQAKYQGKKDEASVRKMQAETSAVYEKYGTSPTGGCLYLVIQLPILFALYQVIYRVPAYITSVNDLYMQIATPLSQVSGGGDMIQTLITDLSLNRVTNFDFSNTSSIVDFLAALKTADWATVSDTFSNYSDVVNAIAQYSPEIMRVNSIFGFLNVSDLPLSGGWWPGVLIPILSGLSQFVSMQISMANQPQTNNQNGMMGNMKVMNGVMILFSVYICFTLNIGIGLYWIANSVLRTIIMVITNKYIDKKGLDTLIEENKAKRKKKLEKKGGKTSKFEEYAKMSTKNYDEAASKKKSIKELAATSTVSKDELKNSGKNTNKNTSKNTSKNISKGISEGTDQVTAGSAAEQTTDTKNQTEQKKDAESSPKSGKKKNKGEVENIAKIAHMQVGGNYKKK